MRARRVTAAVALALVTLTAVAGVALAQHHRRHRRHHDDAASGEADAGVAEAVATDAGVDARVGPSHGPTRGGGDVHGAPSASCPERWRATTSTNDRAGGANVCDSSSDCTIAPAVCCMPCDGSPIRGQDVVAIAGNAAQTWSESLCTSEDSCRHCPFQPGAELKAQCDDGRCTVYERVPCH